MTTPFQSAMAKLAAIEAGEPLVDRALRIRIELALSPSEAAAIRERLASDEKALAFARDHLDDAGFLACETCGVPLAHDEYAPVQDFIGCWRAATDKPYGPCWCDERSALAQPGTMASANRATPPGAAQ